MSTDAHAGTTPSEPTQPALNADNGHSDKPPSAAAPASERAAAAAEAAHSDDSDPGADAGASDYAVADVEGVQASDLEELLANFARRLELGEVDAATVQALQELGVIRVAGRRGAPCPSRPPLLNSFGLEGVAEYIKEGRAKNIIVMCGAGVSVSAGIPDFRSPGTGLYSNLQRFNLPTPEAVFELGYFRRNPKPFHLLAKELFPGNFAPTPAHLFMKLLDDKGLLLRVFTQNIDDLEHEAGLPRDKVVAAHGNFGSARCIRCGKEHSMDYVKQAVFADEICYCQKCGIRGLVKPDIVFFGENLPDRFYERAEADFPRADLLIVMGTSLVVHPFASLIDCVRPRAPRLLINRERVGEGGTYQIIPGMGGGDGFDFDARHRDALFLGDCDDGAARLAGLLGWGEELEELVEVIASAAGRGSGGGGGAGPAGAATGEEAGALRAAALAEGIRDSQGAAEGSGKGPGGGALEGTEA